MTRPDYECRIAGRLVRTFNALDLAESYRDRMAREGATVTVQAVRPIRRAA